MDKSSLFDIKTWQGKVIAGTAVVAGVYGLYLIARKPKRNNLDVEKLTKILGEFVKSSDECSRQIAGREKALRQSARAAGKPIPDDQLLAYLQQEFESMMQLREARIYEKFKTTETECKIAWQKHRNVERLKELETKILDAASLFEPQERSAPLDEEKLLELVGELIDATSKAMRKVAADLKKQGITPQSDQFFQLFQKLFSQRSEKIQQEIPAKYGVSEADYNSAVQKYGDSSAFQAKLDSLKKNQQRVFEEACMP